MWVAKKWRGYVLVAFLVLLPLAYFISGSFCGRQIAEAVPRAPENVFAAPLDSMTIGVNWVPVAGALGYKIYRSTDGTTYSYVYTVQGELNAWFVDSGLAASTRYYYRVKAYDATGDSSFSADNSYSNTTTLPPRAPRGVAVTAGDGRVTITWNANPEPNIVGYNVYRSEVSGGAVVKLNTSPLTTTSYVDTTVINYRDYYYRVSAVDNRGKEGAMSPERWAKPEANPPVFVPHVQYTVESQECAVCHVAHSALGSELIVRSREPEVCFVCHDGTGSQNITYQEFSGDYPSRHPVPAGSNPGTLICGDCHNPHLDHYATGPDNSKLYPKLLSVSINNVVYHKGNEICYKCHGVGSSLIGGDHETPFNGSIHNTAVPDPPSETKIKCSTCHEPHASPNDNLKVYKEENACFQCHYPESSTANAPDIYDRVFANPDPTTHHDIFDADQQANGSKIECVNCHNPHGITSTQKTVDPDSPAPQNLWSGTMRAFCERCHDGSFPTAQQTQPYAPGVSSGTQTLTNIKQTFLSEQHGEGVASSTLVMDPSMGWQRGDVVPCSACHEPHGTPNGWNLRSTVYSKDGTRKKEGLMVLKLPDGGYDFRYFCNGCHGRNHMGNRKSWPTDCMSGNCHKHGESSF